MALACNGPPFILEELSRSGTPRSRAILYQFLGLVKLFKFRVSLLKFYILCSCNYLILKEEDPQERGSATKKSESVL